MKLCFRFPNFTLMLELIFAQRFLLPSSLVDPIIVLGIAMDSTDVPISTDCSM
jgi:hypothetical protein